MSVQVILNKTYQALRFTKATPVRRPLKDFVKATFGPAILDWISPISNWIEVIAAVMIAVFEWKEAGFLQVLCAVAIGVIQCFKIVDQTMNKREKAAETLLSIEENVARIKSELEHLVECHLGNNDDYRATLLLLVRDGESRDFLQPTVRNGHFRIDNRSKLRINETAGINEGVAGVAWSRFSAQYMATDIDPAADQAGYCSVMNASAEMLNDRTVRKPKVVLAVPVSINGKKAAIVCIDGLRSTNLLGTDVVLLPPNPKPRGGRSQDSFRDEHLQKFLANEIQRRFPPLIEAAMTLSGENKNGN